MDLTWCTFFPLLTAGVILLIPARAKTLIKGLAVIGALVTFILSIGLWRGYRDESLGRAGASASERLAEVQDELLTAPFPVEGTRNEFKSRYLPKRNAAGELELFSADRLVDIRREILDQDGAGPEALKAWEQCVDLAYAMDVDAAEHIRYVEFVPWIRLFKVNYFMGVDGLSLPLVLLTALLSVLCLVYSWTVEKGTKGFYILFLLLETGLIGVFCALDFFLFYVFWEIVLLPMYFLIGIWGGPQRLYAAIKFFIYTLVGSVLMLIVMLIMYFSSEPHTFNVLTLMKLVPEFSHGLQWWVFLLLFIGFAIKVPVFPFHTWLPDAHVEAPTSVSVILAGVLLKMGGYGLFRFSYPMAPDAATSKFFIALIAILGLINIVYGAFCALAQKDFKRLVAYSSISHMGYVLLGLAALTYYGVNGAALQMLNHGVSSAMMFLLVGVIYDRAHHRDLSRFGGIGLQMPWYTGLATVGFFASLGLPGLNGFISEAMCFLGAWNTDAATGSLITTTETGGIGASWIVIVSLLGVVLAACYILWTIQRVYLGTIKNDEYRKFPDVSLREVIALAPLAFLCVALGVYPSILIDFMDGSLTAMTDMVRAALGN